MQDIYGISEPKGGGNAILIDYDTDSNVIFQDNLLPYAVMKSFVKSGIIDVAIHKLKDKAGVNLEYIVFGDKVYLLQESKGNYSFLTGKEALEKIIPCAIKNNELNIELIRAALMDMHRRDATLLEQVLIRCPDKAEGFSEINMESILKNYANEVAKSYTVKPIFFSKDASPEAEPPMDGSPSASPEPKI